MEGADRVMCVEMGALMAMMMATTARKQELLMVNRSMTLSIGVVV